MLRALHERPREALRERLDGGLAGRDVALQLARGGRVLLRLLCPALRAGLDRLLGRFAVRFVLDKLAVKLGFQVDRLGD